MRRRLRIPEPVIRLRGDDASWDLDGVHVLAELETPEDIRRWLEYRSQLADEYDSPSEVVEVLWTTAQVAATTGALSAYVASAARKWRDRRQKLPEGTRLTLTISPASSDDRRRRARVVISDIHTKTPDEITAEIRQALMTYAREP